MTVNAPARALGPIFEVAAVTKLKVDVTVDAASDTVTAATVTAETTDAVLQSATGSANSSRGAGGGGDDI